MVHASINTVCHVTKHLIQTCKVTKLVYTRMNHTEYPTNVYVYSFVICIRHNVYYNASLYALTNRNLDVPPLETAKMLGTTANNTMGIQHTCSNVIGHSPKTSLQASRYLENCSSKICFCEIHQWEQSVSHSLLNHVMARPTAIRALSDAVTRTNMSLSSRDKPKTNLKLYSLWINTKSNERAWTVRHYWLVMNFCVVSACLCHWVV